MLDQSQIREAAEMLERAGADAAPIEPLTARYGEIDVADAYRIQAVVIDRRIERGARRVGWKVGLTSAAMQRQLGVDQPDSGPLLDDMEIADGGICPVDDLIAPKVEGEIAFRLDRDLAGEGLDESDVLAACDRVVPALEIIDSRIADWRIALADTVADHASCARFVVAAEGCAPADLDLAAARMSLREDGTEVGSGLGEAVLGHPARAVAWLAGTLSAFGQGLRAGEVVMAGALAAAIPARPGATVEADFGAPLGVVKVEFEKEG